MSELGVALGLVLALEGAVYALFPDLMKRMAAEVVRAPGDTLRIAGLVSAACGVAVVYLVHG